MCPGFFYLDRNYTFFYEEKTFQEATTICKDNDQYLVQIRNRAENDFIFETIVRKYFDNIWLGAHNTIDTQNFKWLDGSAMNYTNWFPAEPGQNDSLQRNAVLMDVETGVWFIYPSTGRFSFLCERQVEFKIEIFDMEFEQDTTENQDLTGGEFVVFKKTVENLSTARRESLISENYTARKSNIISSESSWTHKFSVKLVSKLEAKLKLFTASTQLELGYGFDYLTKSSSSVTSETTESRKFEEKIIVPPRTSLHHVRSAL